MNQLQDQLSHIVNGVSPLLYCPACEREIRGRVYNKFTGERTSVYIKGTGPYGCWNCGTIAWFDGKQFRHMTRDEKHKFREGNRQHMREIQKEIEIKICPND
jgi:hypothetical protein